MTDNSTEGEYPFSIWPDLFAVWLLALALPTVSSAISLLLGRTTIEITDTKLYLSVFIELLSLGAVAAYLHLRGRLRTLFTVKPSLVGTGIGFGLLIGSWLLFYASAWGIILVSGDPRILSGFRMVHQASLPAKLLMCLVNPFFEELVVVGCVVRILEKHGASVAIAASAMLRLAYHLYQGPISAALILPTGILFAGFFWFKRDLWPLVVAHAFLDLIPMLIR